MTAFKSAVSEKDLKIISNFPIACTVCSYFLGWTNRQDQQALCNNCKVAITKRQKKLLGETRI